MLLIILAAIISSTVAQTSSPDFSCFVGYQVNGSKIIGGSVSCSGEYCIKIDGTLLHTTFSIFACEPLGICNTIDSSPLSFANATCCQDSNDCNAAGVVPTPLPTPSSDLSPILCNEGVYMTSSSSRVSMKKETPTICYGDCASFTINTTTLSLTMLTCDPVNVCNSLELANSCHSLPHGVLSACCCSSNLCLDPDHGIQPTPPPPPPGSIKCPAGLEIIPPTGVQSNVSAVTTVDCMGACHNTMYNASGTIYNVYSCDNMGVCDMLDIPMNNCSHPSASLSSCCCNTDKCNADNVTLIPQDPFPPNRAERCFSGFALSALGGVPLGRSEYCRGNCVSYTLNQAITIYGCDPVVICDTLGVHDDCVTQTNMGTNGTIKVCCCSTTDCNRPIPPSSPKSCVNGIGYNFAGKTYMEGEYVNCSGPCANVTASVGSDSITVFLCDEFSVCNLLDNDGDTIQCCDDDDCNLGDASSFQPFNTSGEMNITCFEGVDFMGLGAIGFPVSCQGHCARAHLKSTTLYTCDPADICAKFGIDGCYILDDGLSVCCCSGERCNYKDRRIQPHIDSNLTCLVGYGIGSLIVGAYQMCDGMCGGMSTSLGNIDATAYVCLNYDLCYGLDLYEEYRNLSFDQSIRGYCCGKSNCNYRGNQTFPPPTPVTMGITCPAGVWINGKSEYDSTRVASCPGDCGSVTLATTFHNQQATLTYYDCDPAKFCQAMNISNRCVNVTTGFGLCCCSSSMCMDPLSHKYVPDTVSDLNCFVGYQVNGSKAIGGSVSCSGEYCIRIDGTLLHTNFSIFACEPLGICNTIDSSPLPFANATCCQNSNDCNAAGIIPTPIPTPSSDLSPILCNEGVYITYKGSNSSMTSETPTMCYGDCASFTISMTNMTITMLTCDSVSVCNSLELANSCHSLPHGVLSACCCSSNLCLDPDHGIQPTPPPPPPGSIKCPAGLEIIPPTGVQSNVSAVTTVDCMGACHNTMYNASGTIYNVYSCDNMGVCDFLNIPMNNCSHPSASLSSCCCNTDKCNADNVTLIPQDPFPPNRAEQCFSGFALSALGRVPLGRSEYCKGNCVSYTLNKGITIYGCDPVVICDTLGVHDDCVTQTNMGTNGTIKVCCCSTTDCNRPIPPSSPKSCVNGIGYNFLGKTYMEGEYVNCSGPCANVTASVGSDSITVFLCDEFSVCNLFDNDGDTIQCCNNNNCNLGDASSFQPFNTSGETNITCFEGVDFMGLGAIGFLVSCQGHCARAHLKSTTLYTCDPADICASFGIDGCYILDDGLSVCCCSGERCNYKDRRIQPHIDSNLTCLVGYGIGSLTFGAYQMCDGMCGGMSTTLGNYTATAYLCLNDDLCYGLDLYEEYRNLSFDQSIRGYCCGKSNCNYHGNQTFPPPTPVTMGITCPAGIWLNQTSQYDATRVTSCPGSCGSVSVSNSVQGQSAILTYYECDPSNFCQTMNITNGCNTIIPGLTMCCCSSSMCLDPLSGVTVPISPTTTTTTTFSTTTNGIPSGTTSGSGKKAPTIAFSILSVLVFMMY